jgi:hypothetical protein
MPFLYTYMYATLLLVLLVFTIIVMYYLINKFLV